MTPGTRLIVIFTIKIDNIGGRVDFRKCIRKKFGYVEVLIQFSHEIITVD